MNLPRLSPEGEGVLSAATLESVELGHHFLGVEHLFLGLIRVKNPLLAEAGEEHLIQLDALAELLRKSVRGAAAAKRPEDELLTTPRCAHVFDLAAKIAHRAGSSLVEPNHLLQAIFQEGRSVPIRLLRTMKVDLSGLQESILREPEREEQAAASLLERYGRDLTLLAARGQLSPVIGREREMDLLAQVLLRKNKNNPVLVGEAGVGKTAVVEGLAQRLVSADCPEPLRNRRLIELSLTALVAGTKYRGEFEERLLGVTKEAAAHPEIILFLDEIHTVVGAGSTGGGDSLDASNILKPALARGELRCIGATTIGEFRRTIERDPALERRFEKILVEEPTPGQCREILLRLKPSLEGHHRVEILPEAIDAAVALTVQHVKDRQLPDKALDALDQSCARKRLQRYARAAHGSSREAAGAQVRAADIANTVAQWTGMPIERVSGEAAKNLLSIEDELRKRVFGQDEAVRAVARIVLTAKAGLADPNRPLGVFFFAGPTGVGKTHLAKSLAEVLFGDARRLARFDMSEYLEAHAVAKLIGAPPGYVGHEREGLLVSALRTHPHCVVLFDEVEKAHPQIFDVFLQIFDEGRLTGTSGKTADFTQSVIILTSNIDPEPGAPSSIGFHGGAAAPPAVTPEQARTALLAHLRPELVNRIDEIVTFRRLDGAALRAVVDHAVGEIDKLLAPRGLRLELDEAVYEHLLKLGDCERFGARELHRVVDHELRQPLAKEILRLDQRGGLIRAGMRDGRVEFSAHLHQGEGLPA